MTNERRCIRLWVRLTAFSLAGFLFLGITWIAAWFLMPQRKNYGSLWEQYLQEPKESIDVLFFGSSIAYCDVVPARIWEKSGLSCWVMAGPEQTMPITFFCGREAIKTQSPQLIILEASGMLFKRFMRYTRANISPMPLSFNRLGAIIAGAERAEWKGLIFPLYNYHFRWSEVKKSDFQEHLHPKEELLAGYTLLTKTSPQFPSVFSGRSMEPAVYETNLRYLEKLRDECEKNGIRFLVYLAPAISRTPRELTDRIVEDVQSLGIEILDLSDFAPDLGVDDTLDWYDGLHFNLLGADKFSDWWGEELLRRNVTPGNAESTLWQRRLDYLNEQVQKLRSSIE